MFWDNNYVNNSLPCHTCGINCQFSLLVVTLFCFVFQVATSGDQNCYRDENTLDRGLVHLYALFQIHFVGMSYYLLLVKGQILLDGIDDFWSSIHDSTQQQGELKGDPQGGPCAPCTSQLSWCYWDEKWIMFVDLSFLSNFFTTHNKPITYFE